MNETVYVKATKDKGNGLFAAKNLQCGDEIFKERPLVSSQFSWSRFYQYTACDYCMKSMETSQNMARRLTTNFELELPYHDECCEINKNKINFVKCPECTVAYCSPECLSKANQEYHQVLCLRGDKNNAQHPVNRLEEAWRNMHFPPETATIMLILRIVAMVTQSDNKDELTRKFQQFFCNLKHADQKYTHKLLGEQFKDQLVTLHGLLLNAISIESFKMLETVEGLETLVGMIGMNGQGIGTSSLSQYVHAVDEFNASSLSKNECEKVDRFIDKIYDDIEKEVGQFINCEGSGLYSLQSRCNHSCEANSEVTFQSGNTSELTLVAIKDIQQDEEIFICYLDECDRNRSKHSRMTILRENYLFECTCSLCEEECDQADETSSNDESDDSMDE